MRSTFTIFSNSSIIPPGFKFMELHALTLAARSYALLVVAKEHNYRTVQLDNKMLTFTKHIVA